MDHLSVTTSPPDPALPPVPRLGPVHWAWLAGLALIYALVTIAQWSLGYIDFGDGNYMYIGARIAEGAVVYRDILAPQPPAHLFLGALVMKVAGLLGLSQPVYAFRAVSLLMHLLSAFLLVRLALRAWGRPAEAVVAAAIFLWLPIGFRWALGWQSEPLEIVFLLAMVLFALRGTLVGDLAAALFATLAALTNATAAPFLLSLILYMAFRAPRRALRLALPSIALAAAVTIGMEIYSGGYFLQNVIFNQVGTYPDEGLLAYALFDKLLPQSGNVLLIEGFFVFTGFLGLHRYLRNSPLPPFPRTALAWFFVGTLGSILYVTKGGTVDYIFSLSEPAIALLGAGEICAWARRFPRSNETRGPAAVAALGLAFFALGPGTMVHYQLWRQSIYELPERPTLEIVRHLRNNSRPGERILAPPFYAFLADRPIWGDYSEIFIWTIKYHNDKTGAYRALLDARGLEARSLPPEESAALWEAATARPEGEGWLKVVAMAEAIEARSLPVVAIEMDQTGAVPEVMAALARHYNPLRPEPFVTRNTRLALFVPAPETDPPDARRWSDFIIGLQNVYGEEGMRRFAPWLAAIPSAHPGQE